MSKRRLMIIISVIAAIAVITGGTYALTQRAETPPAETTMKKDSSMQKTIEQPAAEASENTMNESQLSTKGNYVNLAEYNSDKTKYADSKKVYFFHASWCPICKGIDESLTQGSVKVPDGVTLIKTDFDTAMDLRRQYGVTTQYTFVQVDANGNETAQWSATSAEKAIASIN